MSKLTASRASLLQRSVLGIVLVLVIGALAYDFAVARPRQTKAWNKLEELDASGRSSVSQEEVHELIGRTPADVEEKETALVETYRWPRGVPFMKYTISVVYSKSPGGNKYYYYTAALNQAPTESQLPAEIPKVKINRDHGQLRVGLGGPSIAGGGLRPSLMTGSGPVSRLPELDTRNNWWPFKRQN